MAEQKKIQLYTDRACTVEASPETMAKNVTLSDGLDVESVLKHDLTAPTVVHEETSFKIGVGDIDVSSSVVDGEPSKVVIKGKTYQNILPEPSLRNSMTNGKSMQKLNEGYENVNVVDGVAKSAILKGMTETILDRFENGTYNAWSPTFIKGDNTKRIRTINQYSGVSGSITVSVNEKYEVNVVGHNTSTSTGIGGEWQTTLSIDVTNSIFAFVIRKKDGTDITKDEIHDVNLVTSFKQLTDMVSVRMPVLTTTGKNLYPHGDVNFTPSVSSWHDVKGVSNMYGDVGSKSKSRFLLRAGTYHLSYGQPSNFEPVQLVTDTETLVVNGRGSFTITTDTYVTLRGSAKVDNGLSTLTNIQIEEGTVATPYEPYKSNILSTPSDLELRGVGDVQDELNLLTGELTNYYGERIVTEEDSFSTTLLDGKCTCIVGNLTDKISSYSSDNFLADKVSHGAPANTDFGIYQNLGNFVIYETGDDLEAFKAKVIGTKIYYRLAEPVHKTVDLSSYGNWEKVVLDGSETGWTIVDSQTQQNSKYFTIPLSPIASTQNCIVNGMENKSVWNIDNVQGIIINSTLNSIHVRVLNNNLPTQDVNGLKQYLSQNPITVWYQTTTSKENSITEVLSFSNGHIQLSSEEGSLIPSLNYEVPTSNSYHMDLMKANSVYTMKLSAGNGAFVAHNGQEIGYMISRPFNSGQLPVNNLFYTTGWVNDLMILEGDLTSKALPYFKGIKSAFEDESKIEVLSTNSNTWDGVWKEGYELTIGSGVEVAKQVMSCSHFINVVPLTVFEHNDTQNQIRFFMYDKNKQYIKDVKAATITTTENTHYIRLHTNTNYTKGFMFKPISSPSYELHKSNSTKIPLLSPLRSLPNGVCDELIIDRMKKKATLIQRVGKAMVTAHQVSHWYMDNNGVTNVSRIRLKIDSLGAKKGQRHMISNLVPATGRGFSLDGETTYMDDAQNYWLWLHVSNNRLPAPTIEGFKSWLSQNPLVIYYELETPVVTEVDLEGFPFIYKDGHIFLNSEIAPVVEINYNINQSQQIQSNNETLQRHELDILDLDNLIVSFVNAEYNLRLLKFDMELSMMALAE